MNRTTISAAAVTLFFAAGASAHTQPSDTDDAPTTAEDLDLARSVHGQLTLHTSYTGSADFDDTPGEVSIWRTGADFGLLIPVGDRSKLAIGAGVEHAAYEFTGATGLIAGTADPFDTIMTYGFGGELTVRANDNWSWLVGGGVRSSGESGADFGDTITYDAKGGLMRHLSDKLTLGASVIVRTQLEDDALIVPLPIVDWQMSDRWRLTTEGLGARLRYQANDHIAYGVAGKYDTVSFRLDDDGPSPGAVISESRLPLAAFVEWSPGPGLIVRGSAGGLLLSGFESRDATGTKLSDDTTDTALMAGVDVMIRF